VDQEYYPEGLYCKQLFPGYIDSLLCWGPAMLQPWYALYPRVPEASYRAALVHCEANWFVE